jgi:hypothetical protein
MGIRIGNRSHSFHADAVALGGYLEQPFQKIIHSQASSSLAPEGGYGAGRVENFQVESIISFKSAHTQVTGSVGKGDLGWVTQAVSVVEGLNVGDVLTADRLVAQMVTEHPAEEGKYAPKICFVGTRFENLRIGGCLVEVELDFDLCTPSKKDKNGFPEVWTGQDPGFQERVRKQGDRYGNFGAKGRSYLQCSLVGKTNLVGKLPGTPEGHIFRIPEFGKIVLAELVVDCESYRLSMLRLELGCPVKGAASAATARMNGSTNP